MRLRVEPGRLILRAEHSAGHTVCGMNERGVVERKTGKPLRRMRPAAPTASQTFPSFPPPGSLAAAAPKKHAFLPRMLRAGASRDWLHRPHVTLGWRRRLPGRQPEKWRLSGLGEGVCGGAAGKRVPRRGWAVPESATPGREGAVVGTEGRRSAEPLARRKASLAAAAQHPHFWSAALGSASGVGPRRPPGQAEGRPSCFLQVVPDQCLSGPNLEGGASRPAG